MFKIHKKIVLDKDERPFAVQIPIEEFERLEEIIENYGLSKLMDEVADDERLSIGRLIAAADTDRSANVQDDVCHNCS